MDERAIIADLLSTFLAHLPLRQCHQAHGSVTPPAGATISNSSRVIMAVAGSCRVRLPQGRDSSMVTLEAGDAIAVDPGCWHHYHPGTLAVVGCFLHTDYVMFNHWTQGGSHRGGPRSIHGIVAGVPHSVYHAARAVTALNGSDAASRRCLVEALIRQAVHHFTVAPKPNHAGGALWQAVAHWIDEHLHQPDLDRRAAARAFGVSPNHLTRVFANHGRFGFAATVIHQRCERAAHLLRHSDLPIVTVAARCGYPDPSAFAHAFRRWSGQSPRHFRSVRDMHLMK